jgi:hypothetical protein
MRTLRVTLIFIGIVQIACGAVFLVFPAATTTLFGVQPGAPAWVNYLLATAGARFIGYGIGMFVAARAPWRNLAWIDTMIAIQAVDLVATLAAVVDGVLPVRHAALTVVLPALYIAILGWARLIGHTRAPSQKA